MLTNHKMMMLGENIYIYISRQAHTHGSMFLEPTLTPFLGKK